MNYSVTPDVERVMQHLQIQEEKKYTLFVHLRQEFHKIFISFLNTIIQSQSSENFKKIQQQYYEEINTAANKIVMEYKISLSA